jgi:hypothetical protein
MDPGSDLHKHGSDGRAVLVDAVYRRKVRSDALAPCEVSDCGIDIVERAPFHSSSHPRIAAGFGEPTTQKPIVNPTLRQVRTLVANSDLADTDDECLTKWMVRHLEVCGFASSFSPLKNLEQAVGAVLRPPLNQGRPPMWQPNPWRRVVANHRQVLRGRARSYL